MGLPGEDVVPARDAAPRLFEEGERVLLVDRKGRRNLVRLRRGRLHHTHAGTISHDEIIGRPEGIEVLAATKDAERRNPARFLAIRPTLADTVLNMPRGAQVIYPKDLGEILLQADVFPGARVLEAGVGSGALSMALLRGGAEVTGYELRDDFAERARTNVTDFLGEAAAERFSVQIRDLYEGIDGSFDRIVLDLPEPWRAVKHAEQALVPGGILCAYLPSVNQTAELREALSESGFGLVETAETLRRTWHIEGRSVRPDLRMVAHTGFVTTARLIRTGTGGAPGR